VLIGGEEQGVPGLLAEIEIDVDEVASRAV
jgi:hypothetical protein